MVCQSWINWIVECDFKNSPVFAWHWKRIFDVHGFHHYFGVRKCIDKKQERLLRNLLKA